MKCLGWFTLAMITTFFVTACASLEQKTEDENPLRPIPDSPLGIRGKLSELKDPPTPEKVRLGRWLFYDKRLSKDNTVSCATCHRPEHAFSEPTPVSTGIRGQKGGRKAPKAINLAFTLYPNFFWDGRAGSLEEQALGPIENPIEMGSDHATMVSTLSELKGYKKYFNAAFGSPEITKDRIAKAIADYERTRMSGNSAYDRWANGEEGAVSAEVEAGYELFFDKARCNQCHLGDNFTDSLFHNLGVGWNPKTKKLVDRGRVEVSKKKQDTGAFKTPGLRDVTKHAPYMHDGSVATLEEVIELYDKGGEKNPYLSPKMVPLKLTKTEKAQLLAFLKALDGEGYLDTPPSLFPQ